MQGLTFVAPFLGILGLIIAYFIYLYVKKQPNGTPLMQELEEMIHTGAMAFLKREYFVLIFFIAAVFVVLGLLRPEEILARQRPPINTARQTPSISLTFPARSWVWPSPVLAL